MKIYLSILMLVTIRDPIHNYLNWGKKPLVLFVPLLLQLIAYLLWFRLIRPWIEGRTKDHPEQKTLIQSCFGLFLVFCIIGFHYILPFCLQREYPMDGRTLVPIIGFAPSIWCVLFCTTFFQEVLGIDHSPRWGKLLPLTASALIVWRVFFAQCDRATMVAFVYSVYTLECAAALWYNYRKYGT